MFIYLGEQFSLSIFYFYKHDIFLKENFMFNISKINIQVLKTSYKIFVVFTNVCNINLHNRCSKLDKR